MKAHPHESQTVADVGCAVLTVSDSRTTETDSSGRLIREALAAAGHRVVDYAIVPDEPDRIAERLRRLVDDAACRAILLTGGTGLSPRDSTFEVVDGLIEKRLDGFGELFRAMSHVQIGPSAMLSRATAGTIGSTIVFSMPGSTGAVRLALEKLILPELGHIVWLMGPD